jgi:hypothetical protein
VLVVRAPWCVDFHRPDGAGEPGRAGVILDDWHVAGPIAGAVVAVGVAFVLRGVGGGRSGSGAAQGALFTEVANPTG